MNHKIRHILARLDNLPALPEGIDLYEYKEWAEEVDLELDLIRSELREMETEDGT